MELFEQVLLYAPMIVGFILVLMTVRNYFSENEKDSIDLFIFIVGLLMMIPYVWLVVAWGFGMAFLFTEIFKKV